MMAEVSMCSSSGRADLSPEEERVLVRDIAIAAEANSKEGDTFYLIAQRWWQYWIDYVNQDQSNNINDGSSLSDHCDSGGSSGSYRPASIDNSSLIYDAKLEDPNMGIEIHDTLLEGRDFVLLPQEVWNQLYSWYGGGPALPRKVISSGLSQSELAVEVYPLRLQLLVMPKGDHATIRISKKENIGELHQRACEIFDLNLEQVRVWDYYGHQKHALMSDMDKTLDDANIQMDQDILVEVLNNVDGKGASRNFGSELSQNHNLETTGRELDTTYVSTGVTTRGASCGLTGLLNLGNTCFMNSAIQCLVHTPEFARYFRGDYHREINWHNPWGMAGDLALAFGDLLRKLWAPGRTPVAPRPFKAKLARFAAQFSGYNQHDSQELLVFLLDGLHEDLNRVKHKPCLKSIDADGCPDEEVADEYWANHIAHNDSIIVDVCLGQFKSTLVCPVCHKVSVTFDPFMYLSLPLQSTTMRSMTVTVFTCDGTALPSITTVTVPKQGRFRDLIQAVSSSCSLKQNEELKIAEIRNHLIQRLIEDPLTSLSSIKDDDRLAAYKIPKSVKSSILLQLVHRCQEKETSNAQTTSHWKPYGTPLLSSIPLDGEITRSEVQKIIQKMISPLLKVESLGDTDFSQPRNSDEASNQSHDISPDEASNKFKYDSIRGSSGSKTEICLPLQMVDGNNACIDLSVEEEKAITLSKSSKFVVVYFDWSEKLLGMFDMNYLENLPEVFRYGPVTKKARSERLSLYTCLESFLREEPLVDKMWNCPQCKEQRQASKKLDLWRLPNVLVIHLKRFSYSRSMKHKIETFVDFPVHDFDLTNYVASKNNNQRQLYELYALTNHYGSMGSGHYTAHIKLLDQNRWYNFDDSHISLINEEEVKSAAAYVLFYRRVKTNDANGNGAVRGRSHQ